MPLHYWSATQPPFDNTPCKQTPKTVHQKVSLTPWVSIPEVTYLLHKLSQTVPTLQRTPANSSPSVADPSISILATGQLQKHLATNIQNNIQRNSQPPNFLKKSSKFAKLLPTWPEMGSIKPLYLIQHPMPKPQVMRFTQQC